MTHNEQINLFVSLTFLVIGTAPQFPSYLSALLPQDQIFDSDSDLEASPAKKKKEKEAETKNKDIKKEGEESELFLRFTYFTVIRIFYRERQTRGQCRAKRGIQYSSRSDRQSIFEAWEDTKK